MGQTLFEKLWAAHTIREYEDGAVLLYIDRVFLHERTGSIALQSLHDGGRKVANPRQVFAAMDHIIDTLPGRGDATLMPSGTDFILSLREGAHRSGIRLYDIGDHEQGITHLIAAEQGIALPGVTLVCPDSHTCTLGALGALAWGVGSSDCEHVLATEGLRLRKPKQMRLNCSGRLRSGVSAKDLVLHIIARFGADGAAGHALEYCGEAISALDMEGRFTLCNMAVEFSAFTGIIAPDQRTLDYVRGRRYAPIGGQADAAEDFWKTLRSDDDAHFDHELSIDCTALRPMVSWGTSPAHSIGLDELVPHADSAADENQRMAIERSLEYMGLEPGEPLQGLPIDAAFIGSCTNSRLPDLRAAAQVLRGNRVAPGIRAICVPGSMPTKLAAEAEGLDRIFKDAGFEWREPGCSMCFYAGGEGFDPGQRVVSTTNRNFEGRQGPGVRTHIASPATVAASAIAGTISEAIGL